MNTQEPLWLDELIVAMMRCLEKLDPTGPEVRNAFVADAFLVRVSFVDAPSESEKMQRKFQAIQQRFLAVADPLLEGFSDPDTEDEEATHKELTKFVDAVCFHDRVFRPNTRTFRFIQSV